MTFYKIGTGKIIGTQIKLVVAETKSEGRGINYKGPQRNFRLMRLYYIYLCWNVYNVTLQAGAVFIVSKLYLTKSHFEEKNRFPLEKYLCCTFWFSCKETFLKTYIKAVTMHKRSWELGEGISLCLYLCLFISLSFKNKTANMN